MQRSVFIINHAMRLKKVLQLISVSLILLSCWKFPDNNRRTYPIIKVWGYKPVYGDEPIAKTVLYTPGPQPVVSAGNIYTFQNYIFQVDPGLGIHVIDNTVPSAASRVGFITVRGCSQLSIKDNKLYTNSYDDLVVLDFSNLNNVHEYSRLRGVFREYRYGSPLAQPPTAGFYLCPSYDSLVVGWVKDSVIQNCYKN
jgi:hypothetical protein